MVDRRAILSADATPAPRRVLGVWMATALVVGGMIGSGIFLLPAQLAPFGWTGVAGWAVAIGGALLLAFVLSRLTRALPEEPGAVAITARVLGRLPGLLVGWSYWVGVWCANAIIALTAARYLSVLVPPLATPAAQTATAIALVWALTALNLRGARAAGRFQVVTTLLKLLPMVAVIAILLGLALGASGAFAHDPHPGFEVLRLTPALTLAFYALVGFESASVAAERVRRPEVNVVRATLAGTALTGAIYVVVCSGIVLALPTAAVVASPAPIAMFVAAFWGQGAGVAVAAFATVAAVGALNGWVLVQGEVPLGMARAGLLPAWVARTSARDVPVRVLVASSTLASLLILSGVSASLAGVLTFMLQLTAAATLWLYVGACAAAIRLGVARGAAAIGLAFCGWALWGAGPQAIALSLMLMLTALPLYRRNMLAGAGAAA